MRIENETIRRARQTDLYGFLTSRGEKFKRTGRRWQHIEHDSLIISGNMFYWNSRQAKGNSLDFVMLFYGWTFEQAIQELTGFEKTASKEQETVGHHDRRNVSLNIKEGHDTRRVLGYLCKTRGISYRIIKKLIDDRYLVQDTRGNAIFKIFNEHGELVGAEITGTLSQIRFKRIEEGSLVGYGFNIAIGEPVRTLFFESSIDLLSFWTLNENNLTAHRLISLLGLRLDILKNMLEKFQANIEDAYLCVDTDDAGKAFIKAVKDTYPNIKTYLPKMGKDWNDQLMAQSRSKNDQGRQP